MSQQVAIVTGASRGIGAATARLLGEQKASVVVNYRNAKDQADSVVRDIEASGTSAMRSAERLASAERRVDGIGYVTSGSPAPFLKKNIALAYVPNEFGSVGTAVKVEIRGQGVGATVVPTPFYKRPKNSSP